MASLSAYGVTHPPRSNPPLRSSSAPPSPCITPSTVTIVRVVSFMVAVPFSFSLKLSSFDSAGPRRRSHPSESPSGRVFRTLPERRRCRLLNGRSEEHTSELQSLRHLVCRLLLEKKKANLLENSCLDCDRVEEAESVDGRLHHVLVLVGV